MHASHVSSCFRFEFPTLFGAKFRYCYHACHLPEYHCCSAGPIKKWTYHICFYGWGVMGRPPLTPVLRREYLLLYHGVAPVCSVRIRQSWVQYTVVALTGVSGFEIQLPKKGGFTCWCWVRCKDKLPYNGSLVTTVADFVLSPGILVCQAAGRAETTFGR